MVKLLGKRRYSLNNYFLQVMMIFGFFAISGCALEQTPSLPPISPTTSGQHQIGKFVWFDLLTEDIQVARNFYGELFGWHFEVADNAPDYIMIYVNSKPIGGIVPYENTDPKVQESLWLVSLSVEDVDKAVAAAIARNGKMLDGPMDVKGRGRMAVIRDPEGAELALIRSEGGDPPDAVAQTGEWLWVDLFTRDEETASTFYAALVGYTVETANTDEGHSYNLLRKNGRAYGGIVQLPWEDVEPNWLPYVKINDLDETIKRAEKLKGILLLRTKNVAIIVDPTGGAFGIQMVRGKES